MKVTGIIAEYNPFHKGHQFHIEQARQITGADFCVVVMSGDFVQRGEPAIFSKYLRARMALACGADLVLELPSLFAVSSAEDFAACGVALLSALGVVDTLCFGSEDGCIEHLKTAAGILAGEDESFKTLLSHGLKNGLSWPQARNQALAAMAEEDPGFPLDAGLLNHLFGSPNNLLGIEYCKAILRQKSCLTPVTILRKGQGYHDPSLERGQASASALRQSLVQRTSSLLPPAVNSEQRETGGVRHESGGCTPALPGSVLPHIPSSLESMYLQEPVLTSGDLSGLLNYRLLSSVQEGRDLTLYADLSADLAGRLKTQLLQYETWDGRIRQLKTRQYTYTRISRALLHLILGITTEQVQAGRQAGYGPYGRILGFKKESAALLTALKRASSIPLITKTADAHHILSGASLSMFRQDIYASHLRQSIQAQKQAGPIHNEFTQPVCII